MTPKGFVSNEDVSARMFQSDLMERFTKVHPAVPHLIFVPVIGYMLYLATPADFDPARVALLFLGGIAAWTLTEYVVHRFVFHVAEEVQDEVQRIVGKLGPDQPVLPALTGWRQKHYFIAHGVHHHFPNDSRRLVMPPATSIPLAILFLGAFWLIFGATATPPLFAGFVLGYLVYDTTHYAVHHFRLRSRIPLYLKKHHFRHHYQDSSKDYGVSSPLWDFVWGTKG